MSRIARVWALGALASAAVLVVGTIAADAKCARLGFSVNDYGKDGPTRDAKNLLDKHIAQWTAARGIAKYTVGKKDVTCELFLDFGVFDEHTCKAQATVCWGEGQGGVPVKAQAPAGEAAPAAAKADAPAKKAVPKKAAAPAPAKAAAPAAPAKAGDPAAVPATAAAPAGEAAAPAKAPAQGESTGAIVKPIAPAKPPAPKTTPADAPQAPPPAKTKPKQPA